MTEPIFWTCDDYAETLTDTDMDEAIESHLDGFWPPAWEHKHPDGRFDHEARIAAFLRGLPAEMEVYGYTRAVVPPNLVMDADDIIEEWTRRLEDDVWGDPDGRDAGDAFKDFDAVKAAALAFVTVAHENYTPWSCEVTTTVTINPTEWIKEHRPDWLKPEATLRGEP